MPIEINYIFVLIVNIICSFAFLNKSKKWYICGVLLIVNIVLTFALSKTMITFIDNKDIAQILSYLIASLLFLFYGHIIFEETFGVKLFTLSSIALFTTNSFYILITILNSIPSLSLFHDLKFGLCYIIQILTTPIIWVLFHKKYLKLYLNVSNKIICLMALYPLLGLFVCIDSNQIVETLSDYKNLIPALLLIVLTTYGFVLIFLGITSVRKNTELIKNVEMLKIQLELQQQNYKLINESIEKTRAFKHDFRHHISTIQAMLTKDNVNGALEYVEKLNGSKIDKLPIVCKNFTIDSLLKYFMTRCKENNIELKMKMNIPEIIKVDDLDISIILGNCIENAIEACERMNEDKKRFIQIASGLFGTYLVIKIKNSFDGSMIEKVGDRIKSSKGDRLGIGISNVNQIVEKYHGDFQMNSSDDIFEVRIVI